MRKLFLGIAILMTGCSGGIEGDAQKAVKSLLNDPDSAQFFDVQRNGENVCGLVNAKNRMGGYVGKTPFMYTGGNAVIAQQVTESDLRSVWRSIKTDGELGDAVMEVVLKCRWAKLWQSACGYEYPPGYKADVCEVFLGAGSIYQMLKERYDR